MSHKSIQSSQHFIGLGADESGRSSDKIVIVTIIQQNINQWKFQRLTTRLLCGGSKYGQSTLIHGPGLFIWDSRLPISNPFLSARQMIHEQMLRSIKGLLRFSFQRQGKY